MSVFNQVRLKKPRSSNFDLSHEVKMSCGMGRLVPFFSAEALPGDRFDLSAKVFMRFAPMLSPVMHRIRLYTHFFFVPYRLLWSNWENFITNTEVNGVLPVHPFLANTPPEFGGVNYPLTGSLADYFGLPTNVVFPSSTEEKVSPFPFLAYNRIFNEFYRDENLVDPVIDSCGDGDADGLTWYDVSTEDSVLRRAWQHDYFTSCLPFAQKGEDVTLPISGQADVYSPDHDVQYLRQSDGTLADGSATFETASSGYLRDQTERVYPRKGDLKADMSEVSAVTINELRSANALQKWLEKNARGGTRYIEHILAHFGVRSSDRRLDRPEFIFGDSQNVSINDVQQTSATEFNDSEEAVTTPLATLGGQSTTIANGKRKSYFCEEFGQVVGIMSVMPMTAYQQGLHRSFSRRKNTDYYFPDFANLGEQAVLNKEVYYGNDAANEEEFGYIPRFSEYRYLNSRVAGDFRDNLDFWHLGRIFENRPVLNDEFVLCEPSTRIFPVESNNQHLYCHVLNDVRCSRRMPRNPIPSL